MHQRHMLSSKIATENTTSIASAVGSGLRCGVTQVDVERSEVRAIEAYSQ